MFVVFAALVLPLVAARSIEPRIVDGQEVDIRDFPWQGSYRNLKSHTCGCVFVGDKYVLTAGHCGGNKVTFSMEFGMSQLHRGTNFNIAQITLHPQYDKGVGFKPNDIIVIRASKTIQGKNISPGTVAHIGNPGGMAWRTGWGKTDGGDWFPTSSLRGVESDLLDDSTCKWQFGTSMNPQVHICSTSGGHSSCNGDSGGPLSQGSTIYGVFSYMRTGCPKFGISVYTRVGAYHSWICRMTGNRARGC